MGRVNRIWKLLQNLLMPPCLFSIHQVERSIFIKSNVTVSSSTPDKIRNDNLKLLGVHTAADWSCILSISGLLGLTEMGVFGKFTVWLCNNGIKPFFLQVMF